MYAALISVGLLSRWGHSSRCNSNGDVAPLGACHSRIYNQFNSVHLIAIIRATYSYEANYQTIDDPPRFARHCGRTLHGRARFGTSYPFRSTRCHRRRRQRRFSGKYPRWRHPVGIPHKLRSALGSAKPRHLTRPHCHLKYHRQSGRGRLALVAFLHRQTPVSVIESA